MKTIKMTKEQYLEKHKELVCLLGMDMIEKRIQSEQDGLTVYQYGYIFALEKRITELEKLFACAYETLAELIVCPHEVYGFKSTKHNCNECDSVNAETCFCWKDWIEAKIAKEATDESDKN